jgi:hypothetical protein
LTAIDVNTGKTVFQTKRFAAISSSLRLGTQILFFLESNRPQALCLRGHIAMKNIAGWISFHPWTPSRRAGLRPDPRAVARSFKLALSFSLIAFVFLFFDSVALAALASRPETHHETDPAF